MSATPAPHALRLAVVRQRYNPHGGAERFVERAFGALAQRGADVTIIAREWAIGGPQSPAGSPGGDVAGAPRVQVVDPFFIGRLWRDAGFARAARAAWRRGAYDLVQSHERIPGCEVYRAGDGVHRQWLENRAAHASAVERLRLRASPYHRYVCAAERAMFEHPALRAVICNSRMVRDEILRHFRIDPGKLHVIYNGVDTGHFHPRERAAGRERERARLGAQPEELLLAFVGSGFARKGLDAVLGAMRLARTPTRLVVVGRDRELPRFVAMARDHGLAERVRFVGGVSDVRPFYAAADLLVLPTHYDPFPNVVPEALAMGVPAVVRDQCGAAEALEEGVSGRICRAGDVESVARAIDAFAAAGDRAGAEAAARKTAEGLALETMAARLLDLYASLSQ